MDEPYGGRDVSVPARVDDPHLSATRLCHFRAEATAITDQARPLRDIIYVGSVIKYFNLHDSDQDRRK